MRAVTQDVLDVVTCTRLCICRHSLYQRGAARNCRTPKLRQTVLDLQELETTTPTLSEPGSSTPGDKHNSQNILLTNY